MSLFDKIDELTEEAKSSVATYIDFLVMKIKNQVIDLKAENEIMKKRLEEAKNGSNKKSEITV